MLAVKTKYTRVLENGQTEDVEVIQHFVNDEHQQEYYAEMKKRGWKPEQIQKVKNMEIPQE